MTNEEAGKKAFTSFLLVLITTICATAQAQDGPGAAAVDPITQAIAKARQRLHDKPPEYPYAFPKTQYRLALLLDSRLPSPPSSSEAREVASLYAASAYNETHGMGPSVRVDSLTRAASLMMEVGDDDAAESMLASAFDINNEDIDELIEEPQLLRTAHATAFEKMIVLLLDRASYQREEEHTSTSEQLLLERALSLCDKCSELSPDEPVVDEYRGVVLRKLYRTRGFGGAFVKSSILGSVAGDTTETKPTQSAAAKEVHGAYQSAAQKSHEAAIVATLSEEALGMSRYPCGTLRFKYGKKLPGSNQLKQPAQEEMGQLVSLWTRLVRHIILAAAAAREAGLRDDEDRHMAHGLSILSHLDLSDFIRADVQADLLINAGIRHKARGEKKDAARYFRAALEVHPDDGHALVQLASLSDEHAASVTALSDEYVAGLFDGYSDRFEKELVEDLGYQGHTIVADAIDRQWEKSHIDGDVLILDLGVGTGLLGQLLRERITTGADATCASTNDNGRGNVVIRGADLSTRMVDISRARTTTDGAQNKISVYDIVEVSDATAFLRGIGTSSVDIITASDVFIYIGALDEVFLETARVLKKDGLLGFTVELPLSNKKGRNTDRAGAGGLILLQSGRFGHSKAYVEAVADRAGLTLVEWKEEVLRKQGKEDVLGAVVLLQFLSSKT